MRLLRTAIALGGTFSATGLAYAESAIGSDPLMQDSPPWMVGLALFALFVLLGFFWLKDH